MASWALTAADVFWRNALAAVPLALAVAVVCRWGVSRPTTRHALWAMVLVWLVVPPLVPGLVGPGEVGGSPASIDVPAVVEPSPPVAPVGNSGHAEHRLKTGATQATCATQGTAAAESTDGRGDSEPLGCGADLAYRPGRGERGSAYSHPIGADLTTNGSPVGRDSSSWTVARSRLRWPERLAPATGALGPSSQLHQQPTSSPTSADGRNEIASKTARPPAEDRVAPVGGLQSWLAGLAAVREAMAELPRIPLHVWLGGMAIVVAVYLGRLLGFGRRVRAASPAPPSVRRMVRKAARRLGMRRVPETLMVEGRVGPMIWCGLKTRLVLPVDLWGQLDHTGKKAVLCHELAHLRRRDHWVSRGELLVSALYWWHPLVWWVRRRLHEEAEFCCDVWVTWLMPGHRRAYAEALLRTRQYLGRRPDAVPVGGIGVTKGRASRLARRITMVMTTSTRPRLSVPGLALVAALAVGGWLVSPASSCPSADQGEGDSVVVVTPDDGNRYRAVAYAPSVAAGAYKVGLTAPALGGHDHEGDHQDDLEARLERLERVMEKLTQHLQQMEGQGWPKRQKWQKMPAVPSVPPVPAVPAPPAPFAGGSMFAPGFAGSSKGEQITHAYDLPEGKLKALTELMVRSDIPVLVKPGDSQIELIATDSQHAVFDGFVEIIHPTGEKVTRVYRLPEGKLAALTELMVRSDVPIMVAPGDGEIEVIATEAQHTVFNAFVEMVNPAGERVGFLAPPDQRVKLDREIRSRERAASRARREIERNLQHYQRGVTRKARDAARAFERQAKEAAKQRAKRKKHEHDDDEGPHGHQVSLESAHLGELLERVGKALDGTRMPVLDLSHGALKGHLHVLGEHVGKLEFKAQSLATQAEALERQAEAMRTQAEELERRAEELEAKSHALEEQAEEAEGQAAEADEDTETREMLRMTASLQAEAVHLDAEAAHFDDQAEELAEQADTVEDEAVELAEESEELSELADLIVDTLRQVQESDTVSAGV